MRRFGQAISVVGAFFVAASAADAQGIPCGELTQGTIRDTEVLTARAVPESRVPAAMPAHCEVIGRINPRTGNDGKEYATGFHLRLPDQWNGRFVFQGGGGVDGRIGDGLGSVGTVHPESAVQRGYAVVTMDSGHSIGDEPVVGAVLFGLEPQARIDYGYRALDVVTTTVKRIIAMRYGSGPQFSYFMGCSNGGRQGFMASQRFPQHFDGIVAGAPGFNTPKGVLNQLWYLQSWAAAATEKDVNGQPYLATALSQEDQTLISGAVLEACDTLDGLNDGIIDSIPACRFDPVVLQCREGKRADCLAPAQVTALKRHMAGPVNSKGDRLAADWPFDAGMVGIGWRHRALGTPNSERRSNASAIALGAAAMAYVITTPPATPVTAGASAPEATKQLFDYVLNFDFDVDASKIFARNVVFPQSAMEWYAAPSTDLRQFESLGHKMIIWHGGSDPSWSMNDTLNWYRDLSRDNEKATDFARFFIIPGMNHCSDGPATERADFLDAIVRWVEKGQAPDRIIATARSKAENPMVPWPGRTRPLCPYPQESRYVGKGSIEIADNFVCRAP